MASFDPSTLNETLKNYYKKLFPYKLYYQWLEYGDPNYFQRREFAFVLPKDTYLRFKSFNNQLELEKEIQHLLPLRIELGAVYNYLPKDGRNRRDFNADERELVFDIDLTDYDDVRKCCTQDGMCKKCWRFIIIAVKIMDAALDEDFGFDHRLWVYSGRRGIHCWVCDGAARKLNQDARAAIVEYLTIISGGEHKKKKVSFTPPENVAFQFHPFIKRSIDIILQHFPQLAEEQGWFDDAVSYAPFLELLSQNEDLMVVVRKDFENRTTSLERARAVVKRLTRQGYNGDNKLLSEAVLQMAYPRLDVAVTKTINHLLKTPFSIHPKTGKVCVPLSGDAIEKFDPEGVPRVDLLYAELIGQIGGAVAAVEAESMNRKQLEYKRTTMAPHVRVFEDFVNKLRASMEKQSEHMDIVDEGVGQTIMDEY